VSQPDFDPSEDTGAAFCEDGTLLSFFAIKGDPQYDPNDDDNCRWVKQPGGKGL
jgi:hypothetical protein